jgi:hypothetical protein
MSQVTIKLTMKGRTEADDRDADGTPTLVHKAREFIDAGNLDEASACALQYYVRAVQLVATLPKEEARAMFRDVVALYALLGREPPRLTSR